jgi:23S rRNA-intervening sequence protein
MYSALPKSTKAQVLGKQVLRSGTSVGANYREARRARSKLEWSERDERHRRHSREGSGERVGRGANQFIAKCGDCLREIEETAYWLELLADARIVAAQKLQPLRGECDELTAIFVTILKRAKQR